MRKRLTPQYKYAGVYMIKNERNGKVYIGSSFDIEARLASHRNDLARGVHTCKDLQADYDAKHPMTSHVLYVEPVNIYNRHSIRNKLYAMEWKFIEEYDAIHNGYNQASISNIRRTAI